MAIIQETLTELTEEIVIPMGKEKLGIAELHPSKEIRLVLFMI